MDRHMNTPTGTCYHIQGGLPPVDYPMVSEMLPTPSAIIIIITVPTPFPFREDWIGTIKYKGVRSTFVMQLTIWHTPVTRDTTSKLHDAHVVSCLGLPGLRTNPTIASLSETQTAPSLKPLADTEHGNRQRKARRLSVTAFHPCVDM